MTLTSDYLGWLICLTSTDQGWQIEAKRLAFPQSFISTIYTDVRQAIAEVQQFIQVYEIQHRFYHWLEAMSDQGLPQSGYESGIRLMVDLSDLVAPTLRDQIPLEPPSQNPSS